MFALTQITNTEIFAFIAGLDFKLLSLKVLFINRKDNGNCSKVGYFLKTANFTGKLLRKLKIVGMQNFQDTFETT